MRFCMHAGGCHRLLTAGFGACGDVPENLEGVVRLEKLAERLGTLRTDAVAVKPANNGACMASAAIDSKGEGKLATHLSKVRTLLRARPFERASAPPGPSSFSSRLHRQHDTRGGVIGC